MSNVCFTFSFISHFRFSVSFFISWALHKWLVGWLVGAMNAAWIRFTMNDERWIQQIYKNEIHWCMRFCSLRSRLTTSFFPLYFSFFNKSSWILHFVNCMWSATIDVCSILFSFSFIFNSISFCSFCLFILWKHGFFLETKNEIRIFEPKIVPCHLSNDRCWFSDMAFARASEMRYKIELSAFSVALIWQYEWVLSTLIHFLLSYIILFHCSTDLNDANEFCFCVLERAFTNHIYILYCYLNLYSRMCIIAFIFWFSVQRAILIRFPQTMLHLSQLINRISIRI